MKLSVLQTSIALAVVSSHVRYIRSWTNIVSDSVKSQFKALFIFCALACLPSRATSAPPDRSYRADVIVPLP